MSNLLMTLLKPLAVRLTAPLVAEAKNQFHGVLVAFCLAATGIACVVTGLAYFASSLWHGLVPIIGTVGADLILGFSYAGVAAALLIGSVRMVR
jgi:hypothetical protein